MNIAILGAKGTGKSHLTMQLRAQLPSGFVLQDAPAPEHWPSRFDLRLLMGLDLFPEHNSPAHRQADHAMRATLTQHALPFSLVYGTGAARCANALQAIRFHLREPTALDSPQGRWRWPCEKCSDPQCEHRLFSALLPPR